MSPDNWPEPGYRDQGATLRARARAKLVANVRDQILVLNRDHGHAITEAQADERARNIVAGLNEIFDIACDEAGDDIVAGIVGVPEAPTHCSDSHCELPAGHAGAHQMGIYIRGPR